MFIEIMKSIENNFDDPKVNELLNKHFIELRSVSPEGSSHVLDIPGLKFIVFVTGFHVFVERKVVEGSR